MKIEKSVRNRIILALIIVVSLAVVIYFYMWYHTYEKEKLNVSPVSDYLNVIHYNELDNYLTENKNAILYVSVSNDSDIYNFEKKFKKLINKNLLNNSVLYLDITTELDSSSTSRQIEEKYNFNVPSIIIFDDGEIVSKFNIKDNDYDVNLLKYYLVSEGIIND